MRGGPNGYAYANGDPASFIDPDGLMGNSPGGGGKAAPGPVRFAGGGAKPGLCGTGWNEPFVPDAIGSINFGTACKMHDACYDKCGADRIACDVQFRRDVMRECAKLDGMGRAFCKTTAVDYAVSVDTLGVSAFKKAQSKCKSTCMPQ